MARGVTFNKSDRALDKVLKFNEHNRIDAPPVLNLREQMFQANVELQKRKNEKERVEALKEEQREQTRFIQDSIHFHRV
jgi:hypothetical protein